MILGRRDFCKRLSRCVQSMALPGVSLFSGLSLWLLLAGVLLPFSALSASVILPMGEQYRLNLANYSEYRFVDDAVTYPEMQQSAASGWQVLRGNSASFGYKPGKAAWFRFSIQSDISASPYLLFDYAILDDIQVFIEQPGDAPPVVKYSGDHLAPASREVQHRKLVVPLALNAGQTQIYVRVKTGSSYTVPMLLTGKAHFNETESLNNILLSGLTGGALFMILLNLFGGIRLRHPGYLYYAAFATAFTLFNLTMHGYFRYYLLPVWPHFNDMLTVVWGQLGGMTYALFLTVFLPLKKYYPVDYKVCQAHAVLCALLVLLSVVGLYNHIQIVTHLLNATFALYSMVLAIRAWRGGVTTAVYLVLGWVCLMVGVIAKAMTALGLLAYSDILFHSFDVGMTLNFTLIAFGLASRIVDIQEREKVAREEADSAKTLAILNMEHYRALFEYAPIPMFKVNEQDHFIEANKAFLKLFGYPSQQALVTAKVQSRSVYCRQKDYLKLLSDLRHYGVADAETKIRSTQGTEHWVRISVRKVTDSDVIIYEGACIDVTAQVEQQAFEIAAHKREVNQLEALVAGVAHYLNTPLGTANTAQSVVSGKTTEVEQDLSAQKLTAARLRNFLDVVQQSGQVIKSSLDKSINVVERFKELNPEEQQVIRTPIKGTELLKTLKATLPQDIQDNVAILLDDTTDKVRLLPIKPLIDVLKKLTINAWHHGAATEVYIAINEGAGGLNIVVKDNGKGLSEEVRAEDLFAPFYARTLSLQEVSGLDLFVVKTIVQNRLNGKVQVDKGALPALHFHLWLPDQR